MSPTKGRHSIISNLRWLTMSAISNAFAIAKYRERRRSSRASMCADLIVCADDGQWQERTCTLSLNAHGVLVALGTKVARGQRLIVRNPENLAERDGRVVSLGRTYGRRREVAIEFTQPAPNFWRKSTTGTVQPCTKMRDLSQSGNPGTECFRPSSRP